VKRAIWVAGVLMLGVIVLAPLLFGPVFGQEWAEAGKFAQVLAVAAGFQFVNRTVGSTAIVVERQDLDLLCEITSIACGSGALLLAGTLGSSPLECMMFYAMGDSVGSLTGLGLSWFSIHRAINHWNLRMSSTPEMEFPC
jgi:O-antigen/teichoic acid export membrane protein